MSKQTAVEWLANELVKKGFPIEKYGMDLYEQAKAMEKEQIINTFKEAQGLEVLKDTIRAEQFYYETYERK